MLELCDIYLAPDSCLKVLTTRTVLAVRGSCSSPYIRFSRALLSSMKVEIAAAG